MAIGQSGRGHELRSHSSGPPSALGTGTVAPVLAAFPGARILEFGGHGVRVATWDELDLVAYWQAFLSRPDGYLRHLFD